MSLPPAVWPSQGQRKQYSEGCLEKTHSPAGFSYRQLETPAIRWPTTTHRHISSSSLYNLSSPDSLYHTTYSTRSTSVKKSRHLQSTKRRSAFTRPLPKPEPVSPVAFNSPPPPLQQFSTKSSEQYDLCHFDQEQQELPQKLMSDQAIMDDLETWTCSMRTSCAPGLMSPPGSPLLSSFEDLPSFEEDFVLFP
ncbi:hypothetical protein NQZ79_g3542 [Umbelopsis isabellina]|nr:hypothetical protein NQZ79_g3542 [Umbelopsis isabellina]